MTSRSFCFAHKMIGDTGKSVSGSASLTNRLLDHKIFVLTKILGLVYKTVRDFKMDVIKW